MHDSSRKPLGQRATFSCINLPKCGIRAIDGEREDIAGGGIVLMSGLDDGR